MRLPLLAAALSLLAAPAMAADCQVNFVVNNATPYSVRMLVETRTRANPVWYANGLRDGRFFDVDPGARRVRPLTMPVLGCSVRRELRVQQECFTLNGTNRRLMTTLVLTPWGTGLQQPRDIEINVRC
jgi:hypothetical protein